MHIYIFSSSVVYREVHSPDQEENPRETKEETETTVGFNVDMLSQDHKQVNSGRMLKRTLSIRWRKKPTVEAIKESSVVIID